jgi:hypothetical protein
MTPIVAAAKRRSAATRRGRQAWRAPPGTR